MNEAFPFTAIVGMGQAKRSMIFHAIDPQLRGILLMGHRGCAKSTLARAFAEILPPIKDHTSAPFMEVPMGTTEDRLLGSVDTQDLVDKGHWKARAGIIEQANGGILYIDEVNLLPDHLTDSLLDSAASGFHRIEREGLSLKVDAQYILMGSMNPEEGDLRPQIIDRFSHKIRIKDDFSVEERMEIVERRMAYDDHPSRFVQPFQEEGEALKESIVQTRTRLTAVTIQNHYRVSVAEKAKALSLEGVRTEIAVLRTARCVAAWEGRDFIEESDLEEAWLLCLGHRIDDLIQLTPPPQAQQPPSSNSTKPLLQKTSEAPLQSQRESVTLQSPSQVYHAALKQWFFAPARNVLTAATYYSQTRGIATWRDVCRIGWHSSLLASLKQGWKPGQGGWSLRYQQPARRQNIWIFIDASRSTGASRFLEQIRNVLIPLADYARSSRFYMVVLRDSTSSWILKRGTAQIAQQALEQLNEAKGKSYLNRSLHLLSGGIQRQGVLPKDRVLLCSDGCMSPEQGETALEAKHSLQTHLKKLMRYGVPALWLHPKPKRGLSQWLGKLTESVPVQTLCVEPESLMTDGTH